MTQPILPQLSPPQFTYYNELKYSVGNDPAVTVTNIIELPLNAGYLVPILVRNRKKAQALATILIAQKEIGNINVYTAVINDGQVVDPIEGTLTAKEIQELFETALDSNRYFKFAVVEPFTPGTFSVFPVFLKSVIQFYNDDLSDLYKNFNEVAANVFRDILKEDINGTSINPSTAEKN